MTRENKNLLLQDLCARLPYGVRVAKGNIIYPLTGVNIALECVELAVSERISIEDVKPYLRPINTLTKSEIADAIKYICDTDNVVWDNGTHGVGFYFYKSDGIKRPFDDFKFKLGCYGPKNIDWFNKLHFDYRGLIPMGLALPAPEGMY